MSYDHSSTNFGRFEQYEDDEQIAMIPDNEGVLIPVVLTGHATVGVMAAMKNALSGKRSWPLSESDMPIELRRTETEALI